MNWAEWPFIEYLSAVDDTLEAYYGVKSDQDELETIARAHQQNCPPDTTAFRLKALRDGGSRRV